MFPVRRYILHCILENLKKENKYDSCSTVRRYLHKKPLPKEHCAETAKLQMDPQCKVALITGGANGIGLAAASELLKAGARNVVITGLDICAGKEAVECLNSCYGKNKAMFIKTNVQCATQLEDAFKAVIKNFEKIDIVVNCAGICNGPEWEKEINTNITGTIRGTLLAYHYTGRDGCGKGGAVVNISGMTGLNPLPPAPTLCSTHHAIVGFSRSFGDTYHYMRSGIRVMCLCPGFTQTDFIKNVQHCGMTDELGKRLATFIKKSKLQKPEACGQAVVHLIKYGLTGSVWSIEGSRLFHIDMPDPKNCSVLVSQFL